MRELVATDSKNQAAFPIVDRIHRIDGALSHVLRPKLQDLRLAEALGVHLAIH